MIETIESWLARSATRIDDKPKRAWPMVFFLLLVLTALLASAVITSHSEAGATRGIDARIE